jgi:hypothetical protein
MALHVSDASAKVEARAIGFSMPSTGALVEQCRRGARFLVLPQFAGGIAAFDVAESASGPPQAWGTIRKINAYTDQILIRLWKRMKPTNETPVELNSVLGNHWLYGLWYGPEEQAFYPSRWAENGARRSGQFALVLLVTQIVILSISAALKGRLSGN